MLAATRKGNCRRLGGFPEARANARAQAEYHQKSWISQVDKEVCTKKEKRCAFCEEVIRFLLSTKTVALEKNRAACATTCVCLVPKMRR